MSGIYRGPNSSVAAQFVNADGDKGDVVVSNAGELWTIDSKAVDFSKIQDVSANVLLGRDATSGQIQEITCTPFARSILDDADATTLKTTLAYGTMANQDATSVAITGGTIAGVNISGGNVSGLATDIAISDGGTGASNSADARTNLGLGSAALLADTVITQKTSSTGSAILPSGTSAERDSSPSAGYLRFNSTLVKPEVYNGTAWGSVGGGATGGGSDAIFNLNGQTITTNYTIPSGQNACTTSPITTADGVTVTIPDGSNWVIL